MGRAGTPPNLSELFSEQDEVFMRSTTPPTEA
jgi:hypothetical protein